MRATRKDKNKMKKIIVLMLAVMTLLCTAVPTLAAESFYEIVVDGNATRAMAVMQDGTVMVPLKRVAKALGYKVSYSSRAKSYHLENRENACDFELGSSVYTVYSTVADGMTAPSDLGAYYYKENDLRPSGIVQDAAWQQ